jgi:pyruvate dehydrogenase E1 component alpha subunit
MKNDISKRDLEKMLFHLLQVRAYESEISVRYDQEKMRCPVHLSIGQEAVAAAISCVLTDNDLAVSSHRSHAHYLGKGGRGDKMIAEIYGKASGCSGGMGGSMHLVDLECGFKGATPIVGNSIPVGVGLALALQLDGKSHIACAFFGDGAVEEGVFYESLNFSALRKLPVLFLCENNLYSTYSALDVRQPDGRNTVEMVEKIGVPARHCDGYDVLECYSVLEEEVDQIRQGDGPRFIEFATYRWQEHCGPNYDYHVGYRSQEEFEKWQMRDPVVRYRLWLLENGKVTEDEILEIENRVQEEVAQAFEFADKAPFPSKEQAFSNIFKEVAEL